MTDKPWLKPTNEQAISHTTGVNLVHPSKARRAEAKGLHPGVQNLYVT